MHITAFFNFIYQKNAVGVAQESAKKSRTSEWVSDELTSTPAGNERKLKSSASPRERTQISLERPNVIQSLITIIRLVVSDSGAVTHSLSFPIHEALLISIEIVIHLEGNQKTTTTLHSSIAPTAYQLSHDIILRIYQL
jgi:hypothetical protein